MLKILLIRTDIFFIIHLINFKDDSLIIVDASIGSEY